MKFPQNQLLDYFSGILGSGFSRSSPWGLFSILVLWVASNACVRANIQVVDQRTALENQIIGSYEELSKDLQLLSSVRAVPHASDKDRPDRRPLSKLRTLALKARQIQQFIQDDIDSLKEAGCLGESRHASIEARPCDLSSDPHQEQLIKRVIAMENSARKTLLEFVIGTSPNLTEEDRAVLIETWARMRRQKAESGQWIQEQDGTWQKKP